MLLGIWKNVEDIEACLNLPELELVVSSARDRDERNQKFMAAIQGIDLDSGNKTSTEEIFDRSMNRARAKLEGRSQEQIEMADFELGYEVEE